MSLIPINLHLQKLCRRSQLWAHSLPSNHIICSLIEPSPCSSSIQHSSSLDSLTKYQCSLIKGYLVNMDNRFNKIFPSFVPLHPEFSSGNRVIDIFSNHFSFNLFSKKKIIVLKHASINLTVWLLNPQVLLYMLLLSQMLVSKTILPHPYLIYTFTINPSPKLSTMQFMSQVQRLNYSLLGVVSTKLLVTMKF